KVGKQRLIDAIDRAIHYGAYNYKIIDRILKGGLDRLKEDDEKQSSLPLHENIRGPKSYR
ncbi:MAG: IS21 family transposase, partial [Cyclobacteriaceae bacterium]|nr:IS21 family transposase [Cyclobacteriaceae bacterium]